MDNSLQTLEGELEQLLNLFRDFNELVHAQQPMIDQFEEKVLAAEEQTKSAITELATVHSPLLLLCVSSLPCHSHLNAHHLLQPVVVGRELQRLRSSARGSGCRHAYRRTLRCHSRYGEPLPSIARKNTQPTKSPAH
jgi:hypothetical protein